FPKGGALLLGLMGCFGNLAIWQALPQMGAIYESYTVANLDRKFWDKEIIGPGDKPVLNDQKEPLTLVGENRDWLTRLVAENLYPEGSRKTNPKAGKILEDPRARVQADQEGDLKEKQLKQYAALFYPAKKDPPVNKKVLLATARRLMQEFEIPTEKGEPS